MKKVLILLLNLMLFASALCGCQSSIPEGKTLVTFWGWGDAEEVTVFRSLTDKFNAENEDDIYVEYTQRPSDGYVSTMERTLSGSRAPDVFYVGDGEVKKWATLGFLKPLDEFVSGSSVVDFNNMWESSVSRYRYNVETATSSQSDPLYGLPKDIGPTVLYYNADFLKKVGVTIISKDENSEGITADENRGYNPEKKIFNNRIAMTWDESVALSKLLTRSYNSSSPSEYGYFTEWWFSYGWSVGGDVVTYDQAEKVWKFTLGSREREVNAQGVELPSIYDAFVHFVSLSQPRSNNVDGQGTMGLAVSPSPNTLGTTGKVNYFTSGKVAMYVDGRWSVPSLRRNMRSDWDVAPLPKAPGGEEAGHSGSMALGMWSKTRVSDAAYKFIEYISGPVGQAAQSEMGFNIPNQKDLARSEVFLQSDKKPKNAEIFVRAAEYERPGDWTLMPDTAWIDAWAPTLNGDVRNGKMTVPAFFDKVTAPTDAALAKYTR